MISFGFTIYKFFQFELAKNAPVNSGLLTPRGFALIMICFGNFSLLSATISYHRQTRRLGVGSSVTEGIAACLAAFGVLALVTTFLHE